MNAHPFQIKLLSICSILMALIFTIEVYIQAPGGTVAYIFIVLCTLWFSRTYRFLTALGGMASLFIVVAYMLIFANGGGNMVMFINRLISVAVVWLAVYFTMRFRKLYEEQRTKTEQLQALFINAHEGILYANAAGKIIMANPYLEKVFGYANGELVQQSINVLMPDGFALSHAAHLNGFVKHPENKPMGRDIWAVRKNGSSFPVEISLSHFYNKGQLIIIAFILDATEKKKNQALIEANFTSVKNHNLELEDKVRQRTQALEQINLELRKSQLLYKAMANNFPDGIIGVLDRNMKYLLIGGKELRSPAPDQGTEAGDSLFDDMHVALKQNAAGAFEKVFAGESLSFDIAVQDRDYNVASVPLPGPQGDINEILVVVKNITSQKKLERDLLKTLEKEKELSFLKSRFITTASHEFRTPLSTILTSAFLLEQYSCEQLGKEKHKHLNRIKSAVQGLTELLNDFLSSEKLEEGGVRVVFNEFNLQLFIDELLDETVFLKKEAQQILVSYSESVTSLNTDQKLLNNILINLISNACKYSPVTGTIALTIASADQQLVLEIRDEGIGIPEEEHKHVFKRFFRAKNAAEIQGTGLGLHIVKKYVNLLKGSISFTSSLHKGTTFTITLPLDPDSLPSNIHLAKTTIP